MKKQVNLTQSDLYNVIKESVKNVILEFGTDPGKKGDENRTKMAKAAKRAVKRGDSSVYKNAYDSIIKGGGNKEALKDFQRKYEDEVEESRNLKEYTEFDKMKMYGQDVDYDEDFENLEDSENLEEYNGIDLQNIYGRPSYGEDFEDVGFNQQPSNVVTGEGRKPVKVTESQLKEIIREAVDILLEKFGNTQLGQYQLGRLAARKKQQGDKEGYKNVVNNAKLQWGADRGVGTNQNAFGNGFHVGKDNVKQGYDLAKKGKL